MKTAKKEVIVQLLFGRLFTDAAEAEGKGDAEQKKEGEKKEGGEQTEAAKPGEVSLETCCGKVN